MRRPVEFNKEMILVLMLAAFMAALFLLAGTPITWARQGPSSTTSRHITQGSLISLDPQGGFGEMCPLKHTDVKIDITGFLAHVTVTQQFANPFTHPIEAVYTFPLPQNAAVDDMRMLIGDRVIKAEIKRREEAQAIYDAARAGGKRAALLDQERPNIFTQSVANILPGEQVKVTIRYVELLKYDEGSYELVFPMVVGPRYMPRGVPDSSRITPPVTREGTHTGHDLSLDVTLDAGLPLGSVTSATHDIDVEQTGAGRAHVRLREKAVIPNKDFVLRYAVNSGKVQDAVLAHRNGSSGFFTLILQPPDRVTAADITPKELIFVLDTSGSMSGFPIEKAKETMRLALDGLYPQDTFNLITFSGDTHILFPRPVPATKENLRKAQAFLASREGSGGTEMMKAIRAALDPSDSQDHLRVVCFMTDGYVGNDMEIIAEVQKHPNARVFAFGIGSAVNRFLLDKMAERGRGEVAYVGLNDDGTAAARRFHERVRSPLLTDISIEWGALAVSDIYPKRTPDLFSAKPVVLYGRYAGGSTGVIRVRGKAAGREFAREIRVDLPAAEPRHDVLPILWARTRIADLMAQDFNGMQQGQPRAEIRQAITQLGLDYRLMTQFTSLVAVEEMVVTEGGQARRIEVPVEMPEGVSYEGVFGAGETDYRMSAYGGPLPAAPLSRALAKQGNLNSLPESVAPPTAAVSKVHPAIAVLMERLKQKKQPNPDDAKFVRNGRAEIQVWLVDTRPATLEEIKKLGFEIVLQPKTGKLLIGRIPIEKLAALTELKSVRYVAPQQL